MAKIQLAPHKVTVLTRTEIRSTRRPQTNCPPTQIRAIHFTQRPPLMFCRPSDTSSHPSSRCIPGARPAIQTDLPTRSPSPLRPMFPHYGLSRSALQHQKWLWNTRYDEWNQGRSEVETAEAEMGPHGGISNPVVIEPLPHRQSRVSSNFIARATGNWASIGEQKGGTEQE